jgi:hypothetical protein
MPSLLSLPPEVLAVIFTFTLPDHVEDIVDANIALIDRSTHQVAALALYEGLCLNSPWGATWIGRTLRHRADLAQGVRRLYIQIPYDLARTLDIVRLCPSLVTLRGACANHLDKLPCTGSLRKLTGLRKPSDGMETEDEEDEEEVDQLSLPELVTLGFEIHAWDSLVTRITYAHLPRVRRLEITFGLHYPGARGLPPLLLCRTLFARLGPQLRELRLCGDAGNMVLMIQLCPQLRWLQLDPFHKPNPIYDVNFTPSLAAVLPSALQHLHLNDTIVLAAASQSPLVHWLESGTHRLRYLDFRADQDEVRVWSTHWSEAHGRDNMLVAVERVCHRKGIVLGPGVRKALFRLEKWSRHATAEEELGMASRCACPSSLRHSASER